MHHFPPHLIFTARTLQFVWIVENDTLAVFELHASQSMPGPLTSREGPHT